MSSCYRLQRMFADFRGLKKILHPQDQAVKTCLWVFETRSIIPSRTISKRSERGGKKTDLFAIRYRALLSHLPNIPVLPEAIQLDMIYGLLHHWSQ